MDYLSSSLPMCEYIHTCICEYCMINWNMKLLCRIDISLRHSWRTSTPTPSIQTRLHHSYSPVQIPARGRFLSWSSTIISWDSHPVLLISLVHSSIRSCEVVPFMLKNIRILYSTSCNTAIQINFPLDIFAMTILQGSSIVRTLLCFSLNSSFNSYSRRAHVVPFQAQQGCTPFPRFYVLHQHLRINRLSSYRLSDSPI